MVQGLYIQDFVQLGSSTKLVQALQYMFYCSLVQIYKIAVTATQRNFWSSHKICNSAQLHAIAHGNGIRPPVAKIPAHLTLFCSNIALPYVTYMLLCYLTS